MGSKPKAPPAPPDPRIAEEKSRREGIAIGQLERQRRSRSGASSTILGGAPAGTILTRPTDPISTIDPATTAAARKQANIEELSATAEDMSDLTGEEGRGLGMLGQSFRKKIRQKDIERLRGEISPAELQVLQSAKKQKGLAEYITRTRSRLGVTATKGA